MTSTHYHQQAIAAWLLAAFPDDPVIRPKVRASRFLEEALELAQAMEISREKAHELVDYVFNRPVGEQHQELAGAFNCLMACALALGLDAGVEGLKEISRAYDRLDEIRAKSKLKPKVEA